MSLDQTRRRHFIEGLRAVANFYEQNANAYYDGMQITLNMYGAAQHTICEMARAFGQCKKHYDDRNVTVSRQFNEQITWFSPKENHTSQSLSGHVIAKLL